MNQTFSLTLRQEEDFRFVVEFDQPDVDPLVVDEPPPLGEGAGPNPARLLAAAVGNCLSASLLFCMRKAHLEPGEIVTTVEGTIVRDDQKHLRIGGLRVRIHPSLSPKDAARAERCMGVFEDFCIVTESVRNGIEVDVEVEPVVNGGRPHEELVSAES